MAPDPGRTGHHGRPERSTDTGLDDVEREYLHAIAMAEARRDNDACLELSTDLSVYRRHYRVPAPA